MLGHDQLSQCVVLNHRIHINTFSRGSDITKGNNIATRDTLLVTNDPTSIRYIWTTGKRCAAATLRFLKEKDGQPGSRRGDVEQTISR